MQGKNSYGNDIDLTQPLYDILYLSVVNNQITSLQTIIAQNMIDLYAADYSGDNVLHMSIESPDIMRMLVTAADSDDKKAKLHSASNHLNKKGLSPLHLACCLGNLKTVGMLIGCGGDLSLKGERKIKDYDCFDIAGEINGKEGRNLRTFLKNHKKLEGKRESEDHIESRQAAEDSPVGSDDLADNRETHSARVRRRKTKER